MSSVSSLREGHEACQIAENRLVDGVPEASLTGTHWAQHSTLGAQVG
jgi:hypothetical protein